MKDTHLMCGHCESGLCCPSCRVQGTFPSSNRAFRKVGRMVLGSLRSLELHHGQCTCLL